MLLAMRSSTTLGLGLAAAALILGAPMASRAQQGATAASTRFESTAEFSDGDEEDAFAEEFGDPQSLEDEGSSEGKRRTIRLGFWVFDLFAVDLGPDRTRFRMLDFRIIKLLEIGSGSNYHSFSLLELPHLLTLAKTQRDGATYEHRLLDLEAVELAVARHRRSTPKDAETHLLKVPVLGSALGRDIRVTQADEDSPEEVRERQMVLYVLRHEVDRPGL